MLKKQKKQWSDLSLPGKLAMVVIGVIEALMTTYALRDLRSRDRSSLRGPKWLWMLICLVQPVGPVVYITIGRKD